MDERIERQKAFVAEHFALENAHNWAAVVESFTAPNPAFELVPAAARFAEKAGIAGAYNILATALPDVQLEVLRAFDLPGCSVREIVATGTHRGDFFGLAGSGRRVRIEMACFFEFDFEGRLATERVYFDNARVFAQMRGELVVEGT
jgi:steroid delta-isomerase-like uncharacterized protein